MPNNIYGTKSPNLWDVIMNSQIANRHYHIFTARRYASAVYAVVVCASVCRSHAGIVPKLLNVG